MMDNKDPAQSQRQIIESWVSKQPKDSKGDLIPLRMNRIKEILTTELTHIESLEIARLVYHVPMVALVGSDGFPLSLEEVHNIFGNLELIEELHKSQMAEFIKWVQEQEQQHFAPIILKRIPKYRSLYLDYTSTFLKSTKILEFHRSNEILGTFLTKKGNSEESKRLPLQSHLICPIKRPLRLARILESLNEDDKDHVEASDILTVFTEFYKIVDSINTEIAQSSSPEKKNSPTKGRRWIFYLCFSIYFKCTIYNYHYDFHDFHDYNNRKHKCKWRL